MLRVVLRGGVVALLVVGAWLLFMTGPGAAAHSSASRSIDTPFSLTGPRATSVYTIGLQLVTSGLSMPVDVRHAGDGSPRLFVVGQGGAIRVIRNGVLQSTPFLDVTSKISFGSERGLLSLAFDPDYASNGVFYIYYTATDGAVTIERYTVSNPASDIAQVTASNVILSVPHPNGNHNGGQLHFGPGNYLYTGLGDGGGGGDPTGNGQNPGTLLGKMLRLNVRGVPTYTIPATNPFTQTAGYRPEIWALGLRNPWHFAFDRATNDIFIADVGQNCWEEIDYQPASSAGGENYGWRVMEGFRPFNPLNFDDCNQSPITPAGLTLPVAAYGHSLGSAVTGGYVYRGSQFPALNGIYFYSDSGSGRIWALERNGNAWTDTEKLDTAYAVTTFGEDENGELYVADYGVGRLYKLISGPATSPSIDLSSSTKTVSPGTAQRDQTVTYTIVLRNTGDAFNNTVRVTDTIPSGLSYVSGSFAATSGTVDASAAPTLKWQGVMGGTPAVTLTYAAKVTALTAQTIINSAQINPVIGPTLTRSATLTVLNAPPDLSSSTKQASSGGVMSGERVTYTIVLRNVGGPATSTVRVTDTIPIGLSYVNGSFAATVGTIDASAAPTLKWQGVMGSTPVVTLTYAATVNALTAQTITNTAQINPLVSQTLMRSAGLTILNAPPDFSPSTKQALSDGVIAGGTVTYLIVLRNAGGPAIDTVRVTDTIPSGLSYVGGSFAATSGTVDASAAPMLKWQGVMGSTPAITLTYSAKVTALTAQTITNTAQINPVISPTLTRSATLTVLNAPPDLTPSMKQASSGGVMSGETVTYTIVLRNSGGPATSMVRVTDTVPSGLDYVPGTLAATLGSVDQSAAPTLTWQGVPDSTSSVTVTYAASVAVATPKVITNTVTINPGVGAVFTRSATIIANGVHVFLPIVLRNF